jgi:hypothetical protein
MLSVMRAVRLCVAYVRAIMPSFVKLKAVRLSAIRLSAIMRNGITL